MADVGGPDYEYLIADQERMILQQQTNLAASKVARIKLQRDLAQMDTNDEAAHVAIAEAQARIEELKTLQGEQTNG